MYLEVAKTQRSNLVKKVIRINRKRPQEQRNRRLSGVGRHELITCMEVTGEAEV